MDPVPLYDKSGAAVGWYEDQAGIDLIYDLKGRRVVFIEAGKWVINFAGKQIGHLIQKHCCDISGHPVAFAEGATGGPTKPQIVPAPTPPDEWKATPVPFQVPPTTAAAVLSGEWSQKSWQQFSGTPGPAG